MTEAVPSWVLYKKAVFKNFEKSTGKHLCWSLYAGLEPCYFKKRYFSTDLSYKFCFKSNFFTDRFLNRTAPNMFTQIMFLNIAFRCKQIKLGLRNDKYP